MDTFVRYLIVFCPIMFLLHCLLSSAITHTQWHSLRLTHTHCGIDYTQEWVMRLCNPRVCGYPEAKCVDETE